MLTVSMFTIQNSESAMNTSLFRFSYYLFRKEKKSLSNSLRALVVF